MQYDIAAKVILSHCGDVILRDLCGLEVQESELIDYRPQETASLRRADAVLRARFLDNKERLLLIEFLSWWRDYLPLRTLEVRCRHALEEKIEIITVMITLRKISGLRDYYKDNEVEFRYRLVKLYELKAEEVLKRGIKCLYPFVPLMEGGIDLIDEAERGIYEGGGSREYKADLLTGMAILGGLKSKEIPMRLIERRRDIMIESAAYEIIKKEGYEEGIKQGREIGRQEGIQEGMRNGLLKTIELGLKLRFGMEGLKVFSKIKKIKDIDLLEIIVGAVNNR
jgi:hypothetical protein